MSAKTAHLGSLSRWAKHQVSHDVGACFRGSGNNCGISSPQLLEPSRASNRGLHRWKLLESYRNLQSHYEARCQ